MSIKIGKGDGHYFHYSAVAANAPRLFVQKGKINYWVQQGAVDDNGKLLTQGEVIAGQFSPLLPTPDHASAILTLFVQGVYAPNEYEFRRGGAGVQSVHQKELDGLTHKSVTKPFGTFAHRSDFSYTP